MCAAVLGGAIAGWLAGRWWALLVVVPLAWLAAMTVYFLTDVTGYGADGRSSAFVALAAALPLAEAAGAGAILARRRKRLAHRA